MKDIYIEILKDEEQMCVLKFGNSEKVSSHFFDTMTDNGYTIKSITEEQYNACNIGDEISLKDLNDGNYNIEE
jgi:hypothetical protein